MKTSKKTLEVSKKFVSTLDDVLKKNGENKQVDVFEIGAHGMGKYGLNRSTKDYDIYCNLNINDSLKEMDVAQQMAERLDYRHSINNDTYQPNGYKIIYDSKNEKDYVVIDWFDSLNFSRANEIDRGVLLHEKGNVSLFVPRLENLISHKLAALNPRDTKHATDILEIWEMNSKYVDKQYLKKSINKNGLQGKWSEIHRIYPRLSKNVGLPRKLA